MTATKKGKHARFYGLLGKMQGAKKEVVVRQYIDSGSLTDLMQQHPEQYRKMLEDMQRIVGINEEAEIKRLRSSILKKLQEYGINTTKWADVNAFLEQKKIAGKRLYEMTIEEMKVLIPKLGSILNKQQQIVDREKFLAKWN